jgi:hypothetical protein
VPKSQRGDEKSPHFADLSHPERKFSKKQDCLAGKKGESSNQPAVAAPQLWRGTHFSNVSSRLAAPKRQRRWVAGDAVLIAPVSAEIPC